jgi:WD40 repeat protein
VIALAFSADSKILAVRHGDLVPPRRFQVDPWKELAPLWPKRDVELLAFSSDNKTLATTTRASGSIFLHCAAAGTQVREILAHQVRDPLRPAKFWLTGEEARQLQAPQILDVLGQKCITALVFAPDGKTLASAASDKTIRLWDVATGQERQSFPADSFSIGSLAFAPDGTALAWANSAGLIRIWDLRTGKPAHGHDGHQGVVTSVALTPDSKTLITAGADATIRLWETATGTEVRRFEGHQGPIIYTQLSKDGNKLASVSPADRTVRVWELSTGKELRRFRASTIYCDAAWLPDSRTLVIRRYLGDATVHFCDVATGKETLKIENVGPRDGMNYPDNVEGAHRGGGLAVSPDGKMLVTNLNFSGGSLHLWDAATGKKLPGIAPDDNRGIIVKCAAFSPDSKALVKSRSQYESTIHVWDIATRKERQHFGGYFKVKDPDGEELAIPTYLTITELALAPDGRTVATAGWDPTIRLWDVATGKERRRLEGHRGTVTSLAWSADGNRLVSGSNDGTALLWDVSGQVK